jgi:hypothetical protein
MGRASLTCFITGVLCMLGVASAAAAPAGFTVVGVETAGSATSSNENLLSGTHKVGHDRTVCVVGAVRECQTTFFLAKGTVKTRMHVGTSAHVFTLKLTGVSGIYKGTSGTVSVHVINSTHERETFKFNG